MSRVFQRLLFLVLVASLPAGLAVISESADINDPHQPLGCSSCHDLHGSPAAFSFPPGLWTEATAEATCLSCHGPSGPGPTVDVHKNKSGSSYSAFRISCTECHDSHVYPTNWKIENNIMMIGSTYNNSTDGSGYGTINTPSSGVANVVFMERGSDILNAAFYNSFATNDIDSDGVYDGVCEVCHTQTLFHRNTSAGDHDHNTGTTCVVCHAHTDSFEGKGSCVDCHNKSYEGGEIRQVTGTNGDFNSTVSSRHVYGGSVTSWDCIICHAEGDTTSVGATIKTTTEHKDSYSGFSNNTVAMRNVDSSGNPGTAGSDYWRWPAWSDEAPSASDHTNMDTFCLTCHDADGASALVVNSSDDGLEIPPTAANALTPFNSTDALKSTGTKAGSSHDLTGVDIAAVVTTQSMCEGLGMRWSGSACYSERMRVHDAKSLFNTTNPSHHAVLGRRYYSTASYYDGAGCYAEADMSHNSQSECDGTGYSTWYDPDGNGGVCETNATDTAHDTESECTAAGFEWRIWGAQAWNSTSVLINGTNINSAREAAILHCADCHTVDSNAHSGANNYMLIESSVDNTCWHCHDSVLYSETGNGGATSGTLSRFDHSIDAASRTMNPAEGSKLDYVTSTTGSRCLLCHGGAPWQGFGGIHGVRPSTDSYGTTDKRQSQEPYRFIGGSTMSEFNGATNWSDPGGGACYFINPNPQPWSFCDHHSSGSDTGAAPMQYRRDTSL